MAYRSVGLVGLVALMGFMALVGLAGCSQEQAVAEPDGPAPSDSVAICFSGIESETQETTGTTRAETGLEEYYKSFRVWGYKNMSLTAGSYGDLQVVMPEYAVRWVENGAATTATDSHDWEYILSAYPRQSIKYWDFSAKAYRFFAVAGSGITVTAPVDVYASDAVYSMTMTVDATNAGATPLYSHLWLSNNKEEDYPGRPYGKPVTLEFVRPFARVRFLFTYSEPNPNPQPTVEDPDLRPVTTGQNIRTKCTFSVTYPLSGEAVEESWATEEFTKSMLAFTIPYTDAVKQWYMVVPIRNQGAYRLSVVINGLDRTAIVPAAYTDWNPGYEYTYVFKINESGGVELQSLNVGVFDWQEGGTGDRIVYNW